MMLGVALLLILCLHVSSVQLICHSGSGIEELKPQTLQDLSSGHVFEASSTCGLMGPETFESPIPGQGSLVCNNLSDSESHSPSSLNDMEDLSARTWWQSENDVEDVSITLNLVGFFLLGGVQIDFRSPIPSDVIIEVSQDFGASFHPLRYYSNDCSGKFNLPDTPLNQINQLNANELICTSNFSSGSVENSLVYSTLQDVGTINFLPTFSMTNLRVKFHSFGSSTIRYYAVYDLVVLGDCIYDVDITAPYEESDVCPCQPISLEAPFQCPPPTTGPLCRSCSSGFFLSSETNECIECDCDPDGTTSCDQSGQCICRPGVQGHRCDTCPKGHVGPSKFTYKPCIKCFCNGFASGGCEMDEGWYQTQVRNLFDEDDELRHYFTSPGETSCSVDSSLGSGSPLETVDGDFLEVHAEPNSCMLTLSFPHLYLGDKRTAFGQKLSLNISLPELPENITSKLPSPVTGRLELTTSPSQFERYKLWFEVKLDVTTTKPQIVEVTLAIPEPSLVSMSKYPRISTSKQFNMKQFPVSKEYYYAMKQAKDRDIRMALSNIISLRLKLEFANQVEPAQRVLRIYQSSLDFATDDISSTDQLLPPQPADYVERCDFCPKSRTGVRCQNCSNHHTLDPSFGGEFDICVTCFCNFRSTTCDPVSGKCFDCAMNTTGDKCEKCAEGYDRKHPVTFEPCDICAEGFFDPGSGCIPCQCDLEGSLNNICDNRGVCSCLNGVGGDRCDKCLLGGSFPDCMPCDECGNQWLETIQPLEYRVVETANIISSLTNQTNATDVPGLRDLLELVQEIYNILGKSNISLLFSDVELLHSFVREWIDQAQGLHQRGRELESRLITSKNSSEEILLSLSYIMTSLSDLETELSDVSSFIDSSDQSFDFSFHLENSRSSLTRAINADDLVKINFTSVLQEIRVLLDSSSRFNPTLINETNVNLETDIVDVQTEIDNLWAFVDEASMILCGNKGNMTCGDCGGIGCMSCGTGFECNSLAVQASNAQNTSNKVLDLASEFLLAIQARLDDLKELLERARILLDDSEGVSKSARTVIEEAQELQVELMSLATLIEAKLNATRVDPEEIGVNRDSTLVLQLDSMPEEFFAVLLEINATIDSFLVKAINFSESQLREKASSALDSAERSSILANSILNNLTLLEEQLNMLIQQHSVLNQSTNAVRPLIDDAVVSLDEAVTLLNNSESEITSSRSILLDLSSRLNRLDLDIKQNEVDLEKIKDSVSELSGTVDENELIANDTESEVENLLADIEMKLEDSKQDLSASKDVENRTNQLLVTTQNQLLQVENLIRIKEALTVEQEDIRTNIARVVNNIEELDESIQRRISLNTACLNTGSLAKRRRRRRRTGNRI